MHDVTCCSGNSSPRSSQRCPIFDRDRPENSQRCPKWVHTNKHRDLGCVNTSTYTVRVPYLRIWTSRLTDARRNTFEKSKAKMYRERGTRYEFPPWGSWACRLKDPQEKHIQLKFYNTQPKAEKSPCSSSLAASAQKSVGRMRLPYKRPQSAAVEHQTPTYPRSFPFGANILSFHSLISLEKPVTTWLLLNLPEQA